MTLPRFPLPEVDWSITLPETLEFHEQHNADVPLYMLARHELEGPSHISYGQFARACRGVPRLLGLSKEEMAARPAIAILANTDTLIYHTILLGLMLAGAIPFPISQRNTAEAVTHLIRLTSSQRLILSTNTLSKLAAEVIQDLSASDPIWSSRICEPPVLSQLYPELVRGEDVEHQEAGSEVHNGAPVFRPNVNSTCIYLHSSGSTGLPKAIPISHHEVVKYMRYPASTVFRAKGQRIQVACMELPPFHGMAFIFQLCVPLFHGASTSILYPIVKTTSDTPPTVDPDMVMQFIERTGASACFTIPAFLHAWVHNQRYINILKKLDFVEYGGGALSSTVGETLRKEGVTLRLLYGGTEFGPAAMCSARPGDEEEWEYLEIADDASPYFAPQGDGSYELQFISPPEYPMSVTNIPGVNGYATSDLVRPHPTKGHLWKLAGRIDDVIVHSSGEKTVPAPLEFIIQSSPCVLGVVVFGVGRMQPGVLIEPREEHAIDVKDHKQVAALRDLIWPTVEAANKVAPAFSKIFKEMILFTSRDKPFPRTPKLTIMKKAAWALYAEEIDDIYTNATNNYDSASSPQSWTEPDVVQWLLAQVHDLGFDLNIKPSDNLFEFGFDSLGAVILRQRITRAIQSHPDIKEELAHATGSLSLVYSHPSVNALAKHITTVGNDAKPRAFTPVDRVAEIEGMIAKYSFEKDRNQISQQGPRMASPSVVLITGSTGGLGSHVLERLLQEANVDKVYTLNRPESRSTIADRHRRRFEDRGLDKQLLLSPKLVHIESRTEDLNCGLDESLYEEIRTSADLIIHIAWKMNFNQSLESFESNIRATHNLAALARASPKAGSVRFVFTSSVGVAQSWDESLGLYPERLVMNATYAAGSGYGEAKYVSERILATSGLDTASVRIGQITGSDANGAWSTSDWVPIIFQSSVALGALPTAHGHISWLSADAVASTILDIVHYNRSLPEAVNITHPNPISWETMVQHIREALSTEYAIFLPIVPFQKWFVSLAEAASRFKDTTNASRMPAIKLIDFFHSLSQGDMEESANRTSESFSQPVFSTETCRSISKTLAGIPPLWTDDIYKWVRYWAGKRLFAQSEQAWS